MVGDRLPFSLTGVPRSYKNAPLLGIPCGPRHRPTVGSYRGWGSYERGNPVLTSGHPEIGEIREAAGAGDGGR